MFSNPSRMRASSDSSVISTLDTKLVQVCPKSGETFRRISLVRTTLMCTRGCQILVDRKRAGRAGFCSLILRVVAGEGKPLIWSLLLCITSTLPLMYFPIHFWWVKISDNLGAGTKSIGFPSHYPRALFQFSAFWWLNACFVLTQLFWRGGDACPEKPTEASY